MFRQEIAAHNLGYQINDALHVGRGHPVLDPVPMNSKPGLLAREVLSSSFVEQEVQD